MPLNRSFKKPSYPQSGRFQTKAKASQKMARRAASTAVRALVSNSLGAPLRTSGFSFPAKAGEKKFFDIDTASYLAGTTGVFTLLHCPVPGTDYTNRIGRKTLAKSVYIKGRILCNRDSTPTAGYSPPQQGRMVIFIDNQPNGAAPALTDLLVSATPSSQLNPNNRDRFRVLVDKEFFFDPSVYVTTATQAQASLVNQVKGIKIFKVLNLETIFNSGSAGTIADINSGALYMLTMGSTADSSSAGLSAIVSTRVRFLDP